MDKSKNAIGLIAIMEALALEKPVYTNKEPRIYKGKSNLKKKHKIKIVKRSRRINRKKGTKQ